MTQHEGGEWYIVKGLGGCKVNGSWEVGHCQVLEGESFEKNMKYFFQRFHLPILGSDLPPRGCLPCIPLSLSLYTSPLPHAVSLLAVVIPLT
jgi:hypothetical protein